jgi:hypothetical protein
MRETIDVLMGQVEHGLEGVLRTGLLLKVEKVGREHAAGGFYRPAAAPPKMPFAGSSGNDLARAGHPAAEAWGQLLHHRKTAKTILRQVCFWFHACRRGRICKSCKSEKDGGEAAPTPQQSGAATTPARQRLVPTRESRMCRRGPIRSASGATNAQRGGDAGDVARHSDSLAPGCRAASLRLRPLGCLSAGYLHASRPFGCLALARCLRQSSPRVPTRQCCCRVRRTARSVLAGS